MTNGATRIRRPPALWERSDTGWQILAALPISLGLHAVLVVLIVLQGFFAWSKPLPPPSYEVMLVGPIKKGTPGGGAKSAPPGARNDTKVVKSAVPDSQPKSNPNELVVPVATPGGKVDPKTAKAEALARIQREAALRRAQELQAKSAVPAVTPGGNGAEAIPNATAAPGGSGEGTGDGGSEYGVDWSTLTGAASYEQQVQAIIQHNWLPPLGSENKAIQVIVRVIIGFDGKIISATVESSSGDAGLDSSAVVAVKKSSPLPPPPIDLKPYLAKRGVPLRFDPRTKK